MRMNGSACASAPCGGQRTTCSPRSNLHRSVLHVQGGEDEGAKQNGTSVIVPMEAELGTKCCGSAPTQKNALVQIEKGNTGTDNPLRTITSRGEKRAEPKSRGQSIPLGLDSAEQQSPSPDSGQTDRLASSAQDRNYVIISPDDLKMMERRRSCNNGRQSRFPLSGYFSCVCPVTSLSCRWLSPLFLMALVAVRGVCPTIKTRSRCNSRNTPPLHLLRHKEGPGTKAVKERFLSGKSTDFSQHGFPLELLSSRPRAREGEPLGASVRHLRTARAKESKLRLVYLLAPVTYSVEFRAGHKLFVGKLLLIHRELVSRMRLIISGSNSIVVSVCQKSALPLAVFSRRSPFACVRRCEVPVMHRQSMPSCSLRAPNMTEEEITGNSQAFPPGQAARQCVLYVAPKLFSFSSQWETFSSECLVNYFGFPNINTCRGFSQKEGVFLDTIETSV
ncbi:hypothetical protein BaRGS_00033234 [Batillaria attramentaria]|uniref:Uncharacterized protein n=1 Tax=Batillaria attramentaria TaxID=370345 RepID=A0ABD0JLE4_9CAEN